MNHNRSPNVGGMARTLSWTTFVRSRIVKSIAQRMIPHNEYSLTKSIYLRAIQNSNNLQSTKCDRDYKKWTKGHKV